MTYNELFYSGRQTVSIAQIEFITPLISLFLAIIYSITRYYKKSNLPYLYILFISSITIIQFLIIPIL